MREPCAGSKLHESPPKKIGSLTAAVIDVSRSRNNNHTANQFFSTIHKSRSDLDPAAQIFARRVMQIRRTAYKKTEAAYKFRKILETYAERHRRGMRWPKWYREASTENDGNRQQFPSEQLHPSTNDYDTYWNHEIDPIGPVGLLIESIVWHGMQIDDDLQI